MDEDRVFIQVTIPFLDFTFFEPNAPPTEERIKCVGELIDFGYNVAVRIDPIIPRYGIIPGQSCEEVEALVERFSKRALKNVIAKCLRLVAITAKNWPELFYGLRPFYQLYGSWTGNCYELNENVKQQLHTPIYNACLKHGILYSTCLDKVNFSNATRCDRCGSFILCMINTHFVQCAKNL